MENAEKVRALLKKIEEARKEYGDEVLDWGIYSEQCSESDKECKTVGQQSNWKKLKGGQ